MVALASQCLQSSIFKSSNLTPYRRKWQASLPAHLAPKNQTFSLPNHQSLITIEQPVMPKQRDNSLITTKLLAIAEAAADRAEMHAIIGEQRNNWNHLFLHSINSVALTASLMSAIAPAIEASSLPLNISSAVLLASAAGLMVLVNKIQPSQLAEEQRNAARLFKQLERSIHTTLSLCGDSALTESDVEGAMEKVLALQKAYPLPLLPGMLEKFPKFVQPTKWWPENRRQQPRRRNQEVGRNGWCYEMEDEMRGVLRVLKAKDEEQYVHVGQLVLNINKMLSFAGPLVAGVAAVGAASSINGLAVVGGAVAAVVNTLEHGGQMGMVFELCRNCAGYYRRLEEEIEFNLGEEEEEMREQGEIFEVKMALQLGRSLSELRRLASYSVDSCEDEEIQEFAGKLF